MTAARIRELREALGLSMPAFGKGLGCSRDVIANIEYGRVQPKEVFLNHVCQVYGVNRSWLFDGQGPMFTEDAGDETVREAAELFRSLSADLREMALMQMKSLQKLMHKQETAPKGGMRENVDTVRLMAAMLGAQEFSSVPYDNLPQPLIGERIRQLMAEQSISTWQVAASSGLAEDELTKLLGAPDFIRRDDLLAVSLALALDVDETQRLLTAARLPVLYAKNRRDAACMFALMKGLSVAELNELLAGLEEAQL